MNGEHHHDDQYPPISDLESAILGSQTADTALQLALEGHSHSEIVTMITALQAQVAELATRPPEPHIPTMDGAIFVAAYDWPYKEGAHFVCTGVDDHLQLQAAHDAAPDYGGKIVWSGGTFNVGLPVKYGKPKLFVDGFGASTVLQPTREFPAEEYVFSLYNDEKQPIVKAMASNFSIKGLGATQLNRVHGLQFISFRGHVSNVWVDDMTGVGMRVRNTVGLPAHPNPWNGYESTFSNINVGGCDVGLLANSTDQHWDKLQVHTCITTNVDASFTGTMIDSFHFFSGAENYKKTQTINNVILNSCSRFSMSNGKIEHCQKELLKLISSGWIRLHNVGLRNGCSKVLDPGEVGYAQMLVGDSIDDWWNMILVGCRFDKDAEASKPTRNIQITGECLKASIIDSCMLRNASIEAITPFGPQVGPPARFVGRGSTINGQGINEGDPNLTGDFKGKGMMGLRVRQLGTTKIWHAQNENEWI